MDKIVKDFCKVDLHIHSKASSTKTGDIFKVKDGIIANLHILLKGVETKKVNMISITDHNTFDFKLYKALKANENPNTHLKKVLPGVEFDIKITDNNPAIHCIAIFNDSNENKVSKIQSIISSSPFDKVDSYSIHEFRKILSKIELSVILIAHQKGKIFYKNKRDLSSQGESVFKRVISAKYFDAVEFSNELREQHLIDYKNKNDLDELTWITGSDCHTWSVYPKAEKAKDRVPILTHIDALPTFKGLVMSITDSRRIYQQKPAIKLPYLDEIQISIDGVKKKIPLSHGINAIIGDNNVGKSMILKKITGTDSKGIYDNYIKRKKVIINYHFDSDDDFLFDKQGAIRSLFKDSKNRIQDIPTFKKSFKSLNIDKAINYVGKYANNLLDRMENNSIYEAALKGIKINITIPIDDLNSNDIRIMKDLDFVSKNFSSVISRIKSILADMKYLQRNKLFVEDLTKIIESFNKVLDSYNTKMQIDNDNLEIVNKINAVVDSYLKEEKKSNTSKALKIVAFDSAVSAALLAVRQLIECEHKELPDPYVDLAGGNLTPSTVPYGKYKLVNRYIKSKITPLEIKTMLLSPFDSRSVEIDDLLDFTNEVALAHLRKIDEGKSFKEKYWLLLDKTIKKRFETESVILEEDKDLVEGNSAGKNALIYLDILSQDPQIELYIVDQPGDDVSQNRIDSELNEILRQMRQSKQILMVTHKPQLVVNLDVDNVICITCDESGALKIVSGALEYESKTEKINILKTVADELEGGLEVIEKRWKRYDK